ncbi:MAG: hypothetical protein L3J35_12930 [Bacteroidales bacterium]|nr:hypothetical protein [Bacteroidales bacterium]
MKVLSFIPVILSFIILAAHFSRAGHSILALLSLILPFLLFIKKSWVARLIQIALIIGAAEWVRVIFEYVEIRKYYGADWTRLAIILSSVAVFTLLSALIFQNKSMKRIYKLSK